MLMLPKKQVLKRLLLFRSEVIAMAELIDREALLEIYKNWIPQLASKEDEGDRRGVETCISGGTFWHDTIDSRRSQIWS